MTSAAQPIKFTFGREFGGAAEPRAAKPDERVAALQARIDALEAEIARAEQRGHERGYAAGKQDREAVEAGRVADALAQLGGVAGHLLSTLEDERRAIEAEAVTLAVTAAQTLARGLIAREPTAEIMRLCGEALANLRGAPHLVLRVAPDLVEAIEGRLKRLAWERGYEGRLVVLGDPEQALGDCRIEWADGGIVRDTQATISAIEASVARFLAARAAGETE